jgi:hypothetical protein
MKPLIQVPLKYGAIAGVIGILGVIGLFYMGRHPLVIFILVDFRIILLAVFLFFSLRELRDLHQNGILYFWQGAIASSVFVSTFAILVSTAMYLFALAVPAFLDLYIKEAMEMAKAMPKEVIEQIGKDVYERNLLTLPATNVFELSSKYFGQSLIIGTFISIILSVVLRRQPKNL